jgi:hypothetical protein
VWRLTLWSPNWQLDAVFSFTPYSISAKSKSFANTSWWETGHQQTSQVAFIEVKLAFMPFYFRWKQRARGDY